MKESNSYPFILTGDFNTYVGSPAWYALNESLADTFFFSETDHVGPIKTINAFSETEVCGSAIDWICVIRKGVRGVGRE